VSFRKRPHRWKASWIVNVRDLHGSRKRSDLGSVDESSNRQGEADSRQIDRDVRDSDVALWREEENASFPSSGSRLSPHQRRETLCGSRVHCRWVTIGSGQFAKRPDARSQARLKTSREPRETRVLARERDDGRNRSRSSRSFQRRSAQVGRLRSDLAEASEDPTLTWTTAKAEANGCARVRALTNKLVHW